MKAISFFKLVLLPLPIGRIEGAVLVTVWFTFMVALAILFRYILSRAGSPTWTQFKNVHISTVLLAIYYIFIMIDRWLHYYGVRVRAGYVVVEPLFEPFRVASTAFLLSGTFKVVWRADSGRKYTWWLVSRVMTLLVALVSSYYVIVYLALAICWLQFTSLNSIADIATKRIHFELSMGAFFTGYALLILGASGTTCFIRAQKIDGSATKDSVVATIAAVLLFARCLLDFIISALVYGSMHTRASLQLAQDIAYGTFTILTYATLYLLASQVASYVESGSEDIRTIESRIRKIIADLLEEVTGAGTTKSPPFEDVLNLVEAAINNGSQDLSANVSPRMTDAEQRNAALRYIERLRQEEGRREPRDTSNYASRTGTAVSSLFGRITRQTDRSTNSETGLLGVNAQERNRATRKSSRQFSPTILERPTAPVAGQRSQTNRYQSSVLGPQFDPTESIFNPAESIQMQRMGRP